MIEVNTNYLDASEWEREDIPSEPVIPAENEAPDAKGAGTHRETEVETPKKGVRTTIDVPVHENPLT